MKAAVIFDADDTLWRTETLYDDALDRAQMEVEAQGIDGQQWRSLQRRIDLAAVDEMGYSRERFPTSSVEAYRLLSPEFNSHVASTLDAISREVFANKAELVPGIGDVLMELAGSFKLAVVTKGTRSIQHKRMVDSDLGSFFQLFAVVQKKVPSTFLSVCEILNCAPKYTVSVGNSLKSDILPAINAGLSGVWIDAHVWEYEQLRLQSLPTSVTKLESISMLPKTISAIIEF